VNFLVCKLNLAEIEYFIIREAARQRPFWIPDCHQRLIQRQVKAGIRFHKSLRISPDCLVLLLISLRVNLRKIELVLASFLHVQICQESLSQLITSPDFSELSLVDGIFSEASPVLVNHVNVTFELELCYLKTTLSCK